MFNNIGYKPNANFQNQVSQAAQANPAGANRALQNLQGLYQPAGFGFCMPAQVFGVIPQIGYAAMPDFRNAGSLKVDKKKGVVTTPGGYNISVNNGLVKIQSPNGKWTTMKAEPPGRTITKVTNGTQSRSTQQTERVLPRDPAVRESDGDVWRYQGRGTFQLPDGTKITIDEKGKGKDLHINRVDIYNGNKHVGVNSQMTSSNWKTTDSKTQQQFGEWNTTSSNRRWQGRRLVRTTNQQRSVKTTVTEKQIADQRFNTTFSDVKRDGFLHDLKTKDGQFFRIAGDGDDWSQKGKEVVSGAGKGKDDKKLAFKTGKAINNSWLGYRPLQVPWNVYAYQAQPALMHLGHTHIHSHRNHWMSLQNNFCAMQRRPHLGMMSSVNNMGGFNSMYGGPMGGAGLVGMGYAGNHDIYGRMNQSVLGMAGVFGGLGNLQADFAGRRSISPIYC